MEPLTFVNIQWVKPLLQKLNDIRGQRAKDVTALADVFGDPGVLLNYYVVPNCQHHNPADHDEDERSRSFIVPTLLRGNAAFTAPAVRFRRWSVARGIPTQSVTAIKLRGRLDRDSWEPCPHGD